MFRPIILLLSEAVRWRLEFHRLKLRRMGGGSSWVSFPRLGLSPLIFVRVVVNLAETHSPSLLCCLQDPKSLWSVAASSRRLHLRSVVIVLSRTLNSPRQPSLLYFFWKQHIGSSSGFYSSRLVARIKSLVQCIIQNFTFFPLDTL